jgi:hypothetical protein
MTIETRAVTIVSRLAPWLSPLPTAYLVARAAVNHLAWPLPMAVVGALIVETLGLATAVTALELYQYNRSKRQADPTAPFLLAVVLVVIYFASAIILTVLLDIAPLLAVYSQAIFPVLGLVGVLNLAVRSDHAARLAAIEQEKADRKAERAAQKAERAAQPAPAIAQPVPPPAPAAPLFVCVRCGASFERQKQLSGHMRKHAGHNGHYETVSIETATVDR